MLPRVIVFFVPMYGIRKEIGMNGRMMLMVFGFTIRVIVCRVNMQHGEKKYRKEQ